jgi:hypothetical protein
MSLIGLSLYFAHPTFDTTEFQRYQGRANVRKADEELWEQIGSF